MKRSISFEKDNEIAKKELLRLIRTAGIFIGSRAWKVERNDSDYDYLIQYDILKEIFRDIEKKYPEIWTLKQLFEQSWGDSCDPDRSREFYSIIILINNRKYNIISPMDDINYKAWRDAADILDDFSGLELIKEKSNRVKLFECLKKIYRDIHSRKTIKRR